MTFIFLVGASHACIHNQGVVIVSNIISWIINSFNLDLFFYSISSFNCLFNHFGRWLFKRTKSERKDIETIFILILLTIFHHVQLRHAHLVVFDRVENVIFLAKPSVFAIGAVPVQKLFEMVDLPYLAMDGQGLGIFDSRGIIVLYCILNIIKHLSVE